MNWKQIQAEAFRLVEPAVLRRSELELTEYHNEARYRAEQPSPWSMRDHNAVVRAALREATRRGIFCIRRTVK
jgi:hypothetical protein